MDQEAFRSLLATPSSQSATSKSRFGQQNPKRVLPTAKDGASTDFKPRVKKDYKPKKAPDGSVYRDRAAERRQGKEGDFAQAEKLLEDFKARATNEDVDKDTLEDQMKYLGGDAEHSILVKGLDIALLERNKHEQARAADAELDNVEDELDQALAAPAAAPLPSSSSAPAIAAVKGKGKEKKKTRDEIIAEMKAMRAGGSVPPTTGADAKGKGKEAAAPVALGAGWKKLAPVPAVAEKKLRKKKKKVVNPASSLPSDTDASSSAADTQSMPPPPPPASATAAVSTSAPATTPALSPPTTAPAAEEDDDDDIFGNAGDYKGLDSDSDSDSSPSSAAPKPQATAPPPPPPAAASAASKRKYFDDDDSNSFPVSTAPSAVTDLAAKQAAALAAAAAGGGEGEEQDGDEEGGEAKPMRLQGLSGSGPSVKQLLEMDKAAEAEDARKAKKAKYAAAAAEKREGREANQTDADRENADYLKMMDFLAKKEAKKGKSEGVSEKEAEWAMGGKE